MAVRKTIYSESSIKYKYDNICFITDDREETNVEKVGGKQRRSEQKTKSSKKRTELVKRDYL